MDYCAAVEERLAALRQCRERRKQILESPRRNYDLLSNALDRLDSAIDRRANHLPPRNVNGLKQTTIKPPSLIITSDVQNQNLCESSSEENFRKMENKYRQELDRLSKVCEVTQKKFGELAADSAQIRELLRNSQNFCRKIEMENVTLKKEMDRITKDFSQQINKSRDELERTKKDLRFAHEDFTPEDLKNLDLITLRQLSKKSRIRFNQILTEVEKREEEMKDANLCLICADSEKHMICVPCGHLVYCTSCVAKLDSYQKTCCPLCRRNVSQFVRVYLN